MDVRVVATGLAFPEGPAVDPQGRLVVTEIGGKRISLVHDDGRVESYAETGGGPNGCAFAADGSLWVCNNGGSWPRVPSTENSGRPINGPGVLQKVNIDGSIVTALSEIEGRALNAPNDCVVDADGGVWFTDPAMGGGPGDVCYLGPDGAAVRAWSALAFPNGIGITDDGRFLVVCESMTGLLLGFRIEGPGVLAGPARPNGHIGRRSIPDGFCFDSAGRMVVAGHQTNCLFVLEGSDGRPVEVIDLPDAGPTNCCFGGPDFTTLYVTSSDVGQVLALQWPVPGMKLFPDR